MKLKKVKISRQTETKKKNHKAVLISMKSVWRRARCLWRV